MKQFDVLHVSPFSVSLEAHPDVSLPHFSRQGERELAIELGMAPVADLDQEIVNTSLHFKVMCSHGPTRQPLYLAEIGTAVVVKNLPQAAQNNHQAASAFISQALYPALRQQMVHVLALIRQAPPLPQSLAQPSSPQKVKKPAKSARGSGKVKKTKK